MDTRELIAMGERLGLSGEQLRQWVQTEQKHLRDERALEREERAREQKALSERAEHERVKAEQERVKAEQERARAEVEERNLQLRIRLAEINSARGEGAQTDAEGQTTEGYRERFRGSKPENEETAKQYAARLKGYFERWIELTAIERTFEDLADLVVTEQFIANCHKKVAIFIRERECKTLSATTTAADNFMEAQNQANLFRFREDYVRRYVSSCDQCQRTIPKGRIQRVAIGKMPIIDAPFERVAVDIIGPLSPTSSSGKRYILTLVDFATRYPDAVALKNIDSASVAERLLEMFSRVGFPREILCDRSSTFTSNLMREVNHLLSVKQLHTTPYHPMCNGLVERFNGTLRQMLQKMCQEKPKSWDTYLAPLLFAYREVPQSSLGFSPFELIYGRHVRGPLTLMKELWTKEEISSEIKTTYQYILELRERLEATTKLAHERLREAQKNQKGHYDMRSSRRQLKVGDKALLLVPTSHNKLLLHWKGPFPVVEKRNEVDYLLDLGHKKQLFHLNMLKPYKERDPGPRSEIVAAFMAVDEDEAEQALPTVDVKEQRRVEDVAISEHLTSEEQLQIREILKKHSNLFSSKPGQTSLVHCHLELTTDVPVSTPQYPIPFALKEVAEAEVQEMLKLGIAEKSTSPYNSPLVLVKKPDGSYRICIDFRRLNSVLVADGEPIPRTDVVFAEVSKKRYFSKFDLVKGYWQVPLTESSKEKTAFSTSSGHYQFRFMPFGIKTASAVFTRLMRRALEGIPNVHHYIDDVLVATDNWEDHVIALNQVFEALSAAGLKVKPEKCEIGSPSIGFLGHVVGSGAVEPLPATMRKVLEAERPQTKSIGRGRPCVHEGRVLFNRESLEHGAPQGASIRERARTNEPRPRLAHTDAATPYLD
ncbi:uncharacterized protein LOC144180165 [Haemaphysalis longicornis]